MSSLGSVDKALTSLRNLPRVGLNNIKGWPSKKSKIRGRGRTGGRCSGRGHKGAGARGTLPRLGFEGGNTPFYLAMPKEPYYKGHHMRRQYPPVSLLQLQRLIDLGHLDPEEPIDLTAICNTKTVPVDVSQRHYGLNLTDEGADIFAAKVNIEVQWTNEVAISAIERNGGVITTRYFDPMSLLAAVNPVEFFKKGIPIMRCKLPSEDCLKFYMDPRNRGYLADPDEVREHRLELAQKYGYALPDLSTDPLYSMLMRRKDPRQIFFGLEPGWIVNMRDKVILKPKNEKLKEYYQS